MGTKQPIGLHFEHARMPMAAKKVPGGQAEKLGVQDNMILVTIDGTSVRNLTYGDAFKTLTDRATLAEAPVDEAVEDKGIVLGFMKSLTDPTEVHFKFTKQPIGLHFEHARMPMAAKKVPGGQAEKLGVQDNM